MSKPYITNPRILEQSTPNKQGVRRRLSLYYQSTDNQGNSVGDPIAPQLDQSVDINQDSKKQFVQYVVDQSETANNPIPISADTDRQTTFINADPDKNYSQISNVNQVFLQERYAVSPFTDPSLRNAGVQQGETFLNANVAKKEYGSYDGNTPTSKFFLIKKYLKELNDDAVIPYNSPSVEPTTDNQNTKHGRLIDNQLLQTTGQNSLPENKFLSQTGDTTEERENKITLGSYLYNNLGQYARSSYVRENNAKSQKATIENLKKIGLNTIFDASNSEYDKNEVDVSTANAQEVDLINLKGIAASPRVGFKTNLGRFSTAQETQKLFGYSTGNRTNFIDTDKDVDTYGNFYTPFSKFDSLGSVSQVTILATLVITVASALRLVSFIGKENPDVENFSQLTSLEKKNLLGASQEPKLFGRNFSDGSGVYPSSPSKLDFLLELFSVDELYPRTFHGFESSLSAGIEEFFGFVWGGDSTTLTGATQQLRNAGLKILIENGRLSAILRELVRSTNDSIVTAAQDNFSAQNASVSSTAEYMRGLLDSKIVKFVGVLAKLGDRVLFEKDLRETASSSFGSSVDNMGSNMSFVDELPDDRMYYISKSRLHSDGRLSWSTRTAPYYGLPLGSLAKRTLAARNAGTGSVETTLNEFGLNVTLPSVEGYDNDSESIKTAAIAAGRNSAEKVAQWESELEMDYMPFYFHDLRTNEIMSFHAFLEDTSEDFQVEYSSQEGYGRMDKVQIYKGTTRTVSVDFKMVATSPQDHDQMWYKINRLAMMIYPQWTQGREVTNGNIKFIQPFSQIPGATPVIRLRLGDLWKSNYSKMAVARLFGATTFADYNVNGSVTTAGTGTSGAGGASSQASTAAGQPGSPAPGGTASTPSSTQAAGSADMIDIGQDNTIPQLIAFNQAYLNGNLFTVNQHRHHNRRQTQTTQIFAANDTVIFNASQVAQSLMNYTWSAEIPLANSRHPELKVVAKFIRSDNRHSYFSFEQIRMVTPQGVVVSSLTKKNRRHGNERLSNQLANSAVDRSLTRAELYLKYFPARANSGTSNASSSASATAATVNATNFYNETGSDSSVLGSGNPILKSFKSTSGKGLAGVITSFKVNYSDAKANWGTTWTDQLRAPMFVTISITLAVIHDIPLGLDANGVMMAPIWPVGNTSNQFANNGPVTLSGQQLQSPVNSRDYFDPRNNPYINRK